MKQFLAKYMSWDSLKADMIKIYMDEFTESELGELNKFYQTPVGKKTVEKMPTLMSKGAQLGGQRVQEHMPELQAAIAAEAQKQGVSRCPGAGAAKSAAPGRRRGEVSRFAFAEEVSWRSSRSAARCAGRPRPVATACCAVRERRPRRCRIPERRTAALLQFKNRTTGTAMKLIDRFVGRELLVSLGFAVAVLSLVLVLGNIFRRLLPLLVNQDVPAEYLITFIAYVLPFSLIFTIPWGLLTSVLLVFGRLSADNELIALARERRQHHACLCAARRHRDRGDRHLPLAERRGRPGGATKDAQHDPEPRVAQSDGALRERSGDRPVSRPQNLRRQEERQPAREHHRFRDGQ